MEKRIYMVSMPMVNEKKHVGEVDEELKEFEESHASYEKACEQSPNNGFRTIADICYGRKKK